MRGAVGGAGQVAHHHAEAVVERHGDAHPVLRACSRSASPTKKPLLSDVVVRERRALGEAGGARGVLDVDRVVELQLASRSRRSSCEHRPARESSSASQSSSSTTTLRRAAGTRARTSPSMRRVVASAGTPRDRISVATPDWRSAYSQLGRLVGRVDVDQDRRRCRAVAYWSDHPLGAVGRPDAHAVAAADAAGQQRPRQHPGLRPRTPGRRRGTPATAPPAPRRRRRARRCAAGSRRWSRRAAASLRVRRHRNQGRMAESPRSLRSWGPHRRRIAQLRASAEEVPRQRRQLLLRCPRESQRSVDAKRALVDDPSSRRGDQGL